MRYQPWVGLPNILAGRFVVPEFLQDEATPENLAQALANQIGDKAYAEKLNTCFSDMHALLRQDTAAKASEAVARYLEAA